MRYRNFIIAASLSSLAILWVWAGEGFPVQPFCVFKKLTGLPCPGCGGVRAIRLLMEGEVLQAFYTNPLSILFCVCILILLSLMLADCIRKTDVANRIIKKKWQPLPTAVVIVLILANWIWNIYKGL